MSARLSAPSAPRAAVLAAADLSDGDLERLVARSLGVRCVDVLECDATVADYDLDSLTTAGRYRVRGTARHQHAVVPFAFFVKVVQSWARSPAFRHVPAAMRDLALAGLPWRTEPQVYRSDLRDRLPAGLAMPAAHAVVDLDEESAALWLEDVDIDEHPWDDDRFACAAYLLGRLAASPAVRRLAGLGSTDVVRRYVAGRARHQLLPALRDDRLWTHPLVAAAFGQDLRERLLPVLDGLDDIVDELGAMPLGAAHGDACTRNLLTRRGATGSITLVDFAFWCTAPLGFDLSQLLVGEVQTGERPASDLMRLEDACLDAYRRGLLAEGCDVPRNRLRRAHALLLLVFYVLSAVPIEQLGHAVTPERLRVGRERADAAAFVLDLVDATAR